MMQKVLQKMQKFCKDKIGMQILGFFLQWPALLVQVGIGLWMFSPFTQYRLHLLLCCLLLLKDTQDEVDSVLNIFKKLERSRKS